MTRHDLLVQTAAPHRGPTGWFAPGAPATFVMHANLINTVAAVAQVHYGRHPLDECSTLYAAARSRASVTPNRKSP